MAKRKAKTARRVYDFRPPMHKDLLHHKNLGFLALIVAGLASAVIIFIRPIL